jgi:hypothetical protein
MKTFILGAMLALTAVSGVVVASQSAAAACSTAYCYSMVLKTTNYGLINPKYYSPAPQPAVCNSNLCQRPRDHGGIHPSPRHDPNPNNQKNIPGPGDRPTPSGTYGR